MSEFKWRLIADEVPEHESGKYLVLGNRGALYVAAGFRKAAGNSSVSYFYIPNRRSVYLDAASVKAWAEIPPFEESSEGQWVR